MSKDQSIFLITAEDDKYPAHSVKVLTGVGEAQKEIRFFESGGHGTDLFDSHPELIGELVNWFNG